MSFAHVHSQPRVVATTLRMRTTLSHGRYEATMASYFRLVRPHQASPTHAEADFCKLLFATAIHNKCSTVVCLGTAQPSCRFCLHFNWKSMAQIAGEVYQILHLLSYLK